ncbi:MAG: histidinol dehydrogenase [Clostridia bacterium]|nr:histidinol dehydrogenase [Clostridia bacterium]
MKRFLLRDIPVEEIVKQSLFDLSAVEEAAKKIVADVKNEGDAALLSYAKKFDGFSGNAQDLVVTEEEMDSAVKNTDLYFLETLLEAKKNIAVYHTKQLRSGYQINDSGKVLGQVVRPLERVGVYVPGGTAAYPSTVLMDVLPAVIAGVKEVVIVTPAKDNKVPDAILVAAKVAGVKTVYKVGGAQAIAALAYGTETIKKVDKIVGPGNAYVAAAKRAVFGQVAIDMVAGPSEILVVADESADPKYVAADLLSQAEHDKNASAILITDSASLADAAEAEVYRQLEALPRKEIAGTSIENNGKIIVCDDLTEAISVANAIAPEHLELSVKDPFALLADVKNAGSVFLGSYAPEPLGDYFAGPNHTLPTSGTARFSSPLSVDDFVKKFSYVYYDRDSLLAVADRIADFAEREGLSAHANAIRVRKETDDE